MNIFFEANQTQGQLSNQIRQIPKQIRFAAAVALTRTAKNAQETVCQQLSERFTVRTGWVAKGIRVRSARKNNLEATVIVLDEFMALQETGGMRKSRSGKALAVPVGARPTPRSLTRPSKFPSRLLEKPRHFIAPFHDDPQTHAVWRRDGRKGRKLKLMYVFQSQVRLKPRFGFLDAVKEVAEERFQENFNEAMQEALVSARR